MKAMMRPFVGVLLPALLLLGVATGCSGGGMSEQGNSSNGEHVLVDFADRKITLNKTPERIVALGNGEVDIIYALGGSVVGRPKDNAGLQMEAVKGVPVVGSVHTVDLEKIAVVNPDVVLGNSPINANDIPQLNGLGAKVVLTHANSIEDIRRQIALFGKLLGKEAKAAELTAKLDNGIGEVKAETSTNKRVLLVYGAPGTYLAALPNSLAGNVLETAGGINVAGQFPSMQNFPQYAQLNTERVVEADPDVILIMTHGDSEDVEKGFIKEMEGNPSWHSITAVRDGRIHVLPADLFGTNPGTRVVDAVKWIKERLAL
ncbi:ABC transporter substrate-binding protein [Paenibacillus sp. SC116]|uniref:ABC transporter substrate-binding protein n=1 Tax=Paenibacillus sp. SC116 TaxID=2968986 RepID=UPI00215AE24E|nr:ABC transporter substrate-binding protein [Paenibacillus sp. SC116]MCR8844934.1 ABC transporter substrate-binding protein [Paenibacillus sp. SC116]